MKRRDFLLGTAGALGTSLPILAGASTRPCPPSPLGAQGGTQVSASCTSLTPDRNRLARSKGAGVVWVHDFRNYSEISLFSDSSSITNDSGVRLKNGRNQDPDRADPNTYETPSGYHNTFLLLPNETPKSGWPNTLPGVGSGALIVEQPDAIAWNGYPAGTYFRWSNATKNVQVVLPNGTVLPGAGQVYSNHSYHRFNTGSFCTRPLAPLTGATNGRGVDDPAANGTMARDAYPIGGGTNHFEQWRANPRGFRAHPSENAGTGAVLGDEFWLQMRIWVDPNEFAARVPVGPYTVEPGSPANKVAPQAKWNSPFNPYPGKLIESPEAGKLLMLARNTELTGEWIHDVGVVTSTHLNPPERVAYKTFRHYQYTNNDSGYPPINFPKQQPQHKLLPDQPGALRRLSRDVQQRPEHRAGQQVLGDSGRRVVDADDALQPGRTNIGYQPIAHRDTLVEIKVARWGELDWTHIYYDDAQPWWWNTAGSHPRGMRTPCR